MPEYPGERLIVCYNPLLAEERKRKREELLAAAEKALTRIGKQVERRKKKLLTATEIALQVGKALALQDGANTSPTRSRRGS